MRRTMSWPPTFPGGRTRWTADPDDEAATDPDEALRQIIRLSISGGRSQNPFNLPDQLGVRDPTFAAAADRSGGGARWRADVRRQFRRLERTRRARLVKFDVRAGAEGQLLGDLTYDSLETGRRERLEVTR